ncbi:uncharacterized protein LOC120449138 [Drosophila santomea]|uniref:uncharacterized protein LOC120449138 n=1 Tax=Drosophila santomea TaxID=129105 RepID=UPI001953EDA4|nr:uncharacterized protein LOC120449138 [Drosophila santomea]
MATDPSPVPVSASDMEIGENKFNFICEGITKLILWRNWKKSMLVFVILQALTYDLFSESALFVVSVWALTIMVISMGYRFFVRCLRLIKRTDMQKHSYLNYLDTDLMFSVELSNEQCVLFLTKTVGFINNLRDVLILKSFWESFKLFGVLLLIVMLGKRINYFIVCQLGLFLLFTIPKLCEMKQRFSKFRRLSKCNKQHQISKVNTSETKDALDTKSLNECDEETKSRIEKQPEEMELPLDSETSKESQDAVDDLKTFQVREEICSDDFERLAVSWSDEETLTDQTN